MNASIALGLVTVGALLLFMECNRPGRILPGACGLLLLLLGINRLRVFISWDDAALWSALAGLVLIALLRWRPLFGAPALLGTGFLLGALAHLAKHSGGELGRPWALACGLLLGSVSSLLMLLAGQAWRAKAGHSRASAETARTGVVERWGVD